MPEFKINSDDGLIATTLHGMSQNAFVVTEDKVESFNSYSFEFQIGLSSFFTFFGLALGNLHNINGRLFAVATALAILTLVFTFWSWLKFSKIKKSLFKKQSARDASIADLVV